jgi:pimeloyl-ACP methyl ester carboxylesterase
MDEFGLLQENAAEHGLPFPGRPPVRRQMVPVEPAQAISAIVWGAGNPGLVFLHGGAQNAHTWDAVALALGRPLVAVDLPGHGHSDGPAVPGTASDPRASAADVAVAAAALAPQAAAVVGMSLGGLTAIALARLAPELVRRLVLVDVLPGLRERRAGRIADFVNGPTTFATFDEILEHTVRANPGRSESSLRRGILHNARRLSDGRWQWRWAAHEQPLVAGRHASAGGLVHEDLWEDLAALTAPLLLVRGMRAGSVLGDDDEQALRERCPAAVVVRVPGAGHNVQGDAPVELAKHIAAFAWPVTSS